MIRGFLGGDFHCGHFAGLTPPEFQIMPNGLDPKTIKISNTSQILWGFYSEKILEMGPFDFAILNADMIDGRGEKSGGTELITTDRTRQVKMATRGVKEIRAKEYYFTRGTPYHTGTKENWEDGIAEDLKAIAIKDHLFCKIGGVQFDVKHKIGSSSIPHGSLTPLARDILWNRVHFAKGEQPRADVLIRSHTHSFDQVDHDGCIGFILPGLQGFGSTYGKRQVSRSIDFGFIVIEIEDGKVHRWDKAILEGKTQKVENIESVLT